MAGFDKGKVPHVFTIEDPGIYANYDSLGFWAIGSGNQQALSSIAFASVDTNPTIEKTIYDLCAAKFMAESAEGVGLGTSIVIYEFGQDHQTYGDESLEKIRNSWEQFGKPRRPEGIENLIKRLPKIRIPVKPSALGPC